MAKKWRSTAPVRIRKPALERLRNLGAQEREDMVDLLDLAVVLLERELAKDGRVEPPKKSEVYQLVMPPTSVGETVSVRAYESIRAKAREEI